MSLYILQPGMQAMVQDLGRFGYQKYGVSPSGAMDLPAARIANWLVGNKETEAVIELTYCGAKLKAERTLLLAVCGADMSAAVDGERLPLWRPVAVRAGSTIHFGSNRAGCRAYIAIGGGIDVQPVLQSRSTYLRGELGGLQGRALQSGDRIELLSDDVKASTMQIKLLKRMKAGSSLSASDWHADSAAYDGRHNPALIRVITGKHFEWLTEKSKMELLYTAFKIGMQSDRMGSKVEGAALQLERPIELLSEGVATGTVQLPPNGQPIILLADRQTTGGYPRIAHVCAADLPKLAQLKPGDAFRFEFISQREAESLLIKKELELQQIKAAIALKHLAMQ
ncbi:biotin-dependent carboxyltransferase family protein [Paenibacillus sp. IITD108]|uniref:5-oxoprolinase subunit C family protein n=1 Tax=Paenibacillus sp. IITD108 TaxID=3116649 RepID=UPI002F40D27B